MKPTTTPTRIRQHRARLLLVLLLLLPGISTRASAVDVDDVDDDDDDDDAVVDDSAANILEFDGDQEEYPVIVEEEQQQNEADQNIVGGTPTNGQKDAPYFVRGEYGCGAALIAPDVVLGAAHCAAFYGSKVLVGSFQKGSTSGGLAAYRTVTSVKWTHPKFQVTDRGAQSYDMVLFKIQSVQPQYPHLKPVVLNSDPTAIAPGNILTMIGFGYTGWNESESQTLLKANVAAISNTDCEQRYGRKPHFLDESVTCTMGTNATNSSSSGSTSCFGDSGGPMVDSKGRLVGVISFGTRYCDPKYPSGGMNVASAMPWIVETACKLTDTQLPYCPSRTTASPTRAPIPTATPRPQPRPTQPKAPTSVIDPASTCVKVESCAAIIRQHCDCPTAVAPRTRCLKRAVKRHCCSSTSRIRTTYFLQAQQLYRTRSCGLAS